MRLRTRVGTALGVLCVGALLAACVPAKPPAPPPPPPPPADPFFGLPAVPPDVPPPPNSPTITKSDFVTGLTNPWDMAFLPDMTMFFSERPGSVNVRFPDGTINHILTPPDLVGGGEGGMLGVAVDPDFGSNNFLYTCYTTAGDERVVRWTVNPMKNGVVGGGTVLVQGIATGIHMGCRIRFAPDDTLLITTGDNGDGTNPQNLFSLNGKVLRVNADGSVPGDNPFVGFPIAELVYTSGHRNVQGLAFRPSNGQPYTAEHGPDWDDEVNQLVAGGNGGWDPVPGGYNQNVSMTDLAKFPDAMIPAWRSGSPTVAPSGMTFLTGSQWKSWHGALVVAFLKDQRARAMFLDGAGNVTSATQFLAEGTRLRSAVQGPDGNLYVSTDVGGGGGAIWKVVPS
jgi:glucose/arabinose dehydrogenase